MRFDRSGQDAEPASNPDAHLVELLIHELPGRLQPLLGKRIRVSTSHGEVQKASWLMRKIGRISASYAAVLGHNRLGLLLSFDLPTAHCLTDRLFGGAGIAPNQSNDVLPLSASMALEQIAQAVATTIDPVGETDMARGSDVAKIAPFPRQEECLCWHVTVTQEGHEEWSFHLAAPVAAIARLGISSADPEIPQPKLFAEAAISSPFESLPLPVVAVLAETRLPLAQLAALRPGDMIPLPLQREVPLRIGHDTIAHGSIGTLDERVALQLTRIA